MVDSGGAFLPMQEEIFLESAISAAPGADVGARHSLDRDRDGFLHGRTPSSLKSSLPRKVSDERRHPHIEMGPRDGLQNEKTAVSVAIRIAFVEKLLDAGWAPRAFEHSPDRHCPRQLSYE